ncbi:hypothetical protein EYR36_011735 [Pleurotus pulmonarius]|nr:hypothetical protein EYR36_011735 [Pleurotus pulmonarius]KAF4607365.1 hypothetical protein EYR38_001433 [Pleurotus pulmonarius]
MTSANTVVPSDILFEIIDNLEDRDASVFLLVSRQLRIYTLRRLYQSISFNPFAAPSPISLKRLCDNIVSNQGIQFTTAFDFWYPSAFQGSDVHARIAQILPYLSNVQRLAISSTYGITLPPEILRSLSPTARLTHLILDRVVYSEDFIHFLEASPTLQSISIYSFSSFWIDSDEFPPSVLEDPYTQALQREFDQLSSDALPHLRSLAIPIQSPLFGYRPALRDLGLRIGWSEPEFQVQVIVDALTLHPGSAGGCALRTLFVRGAAFASVVNLASQIPSLEYLSFQAAPVGHTAESYF